MVSSPAFAQEQVTQEHALGTAEDADPNPDLPVTQMETVLVSGYQPGPGLWRVYKGEHVLYILGTESPLPDDMTWEAAEVRQVLSEAGVVLGAPGVILDADVGILRGLTLLPSMRRASRNPEGQSLEQVLPEALYRRWAILKERYAPRERSLERSRPMFAAQELYAKALKQLGLTQAGVSRVLNPLLEEHGLKRVPTHLVLNVEDPRKALAEFREQPIGEDEMACFRATLDVVEQDIPAIRTRANAWAIGDIGTLSALPSGRLAQLRCISAWAENDIARRRGFTDVDARIRQQWLAAAEKALDEHGTSFASASITMLVREGGLLQALREKGYDVAAP